MISQESRHKGIAIVSYLTILGSLAAYIMGREKKDPFLRYHICQGLGLSIITNIYITTNQLLFLTLFPNEKLYDLLDWPVYLFLLVYATVGITNVLKNRKKPLPFIGKYFFNTVKFS